MEDNNLGRMEGWIMFSEGIADTECSGIGMIYGVHYGCVEEILHELIDNISDYFDLEENNMRDGCINFEIGNLSRFDGQMSFPETGQWDIAPHWEFDFKITERKDYNMEEQ